MAEKTAMKQVVVVEDDKLLTNLITKKLKAEGYEVVHAENGEKALALMKEGKAPEVILLDILLPGIDGFEVLKNIKQHEGWKNTPVIILSNLGQESDIEQGKRLGAAAFLVKALLSLDEIMREIKRITTVY